MSCTSTAPRMNLQPSMWGPYAWMFLYTIALGYPNNPTQEDKDGVKDLIHSLTRLLPCEMCRHNLTTKLNGPIGARLDEATGCSESLVRYVYDLESAVAQTNGRSMKPFQEVVGGVMSNTYKQPQHMVRASTETTSSSPPNMTALWVLLPVSILLTFLVTWLVTKKKMKK